MNLYDAIIQILLENKVLLFFLVIAIGYFAGRIKIAGFSFGVAAVLFVGLAFGALHPDMALPDIVYVLGLVLFVYTIGLRSGPSFFASFKKSGMRDNLLVLAVLVAAALLTILLGNLLGLKSTLAAGVFTGALTNTPALASVVDILEQTPGIRENSQAAELLAEPVVGYSLTYPIGVMGVILLFQTGMKIWGIDMKKEVEATAILTGLSTEELENLNLRITNPEINGKTLSEIVRQTRLPHFVVSRRLPKDSSEIEIPGGATRIYVGDVLTLVGHASDLEKIAAALGIPSEMNLPENETDIASQRIFVSGRAVVGKTLRELNLNEKYKGLITRIRRGDVDLPTSAGMVLEAGDRVRVVAPRNKIQEISQFLGNSFHRLSEVDYISFSIGISLGLLLGMIPIPLPGGSSFKLGFAAGPLLVALILGKLGRSGKFVWVMSYNANLTLRQLGVVFFLAGIGLKSGHSFYSTFQSAGLQLILLGAVVTIFTAGLAMLVARLFFKMPFNMMMGLVSAMHTQPACLAFANEKDESGAANISYATVYPTAMIAKILLAQLILNW